MKKYIIISLGILFLTACSNKNEATVEEVKTDNSIQNNITLTEAQLKNIELQTVSIEKGNIPTTIRLTARTMSTPQDQISVTNMMGGFVKSIQILPGASVKKGQVLAVLEDPSYVQLQEDYLTTKALLIKANAEFNRQKELNESQAASTKIVEEAKAELSLLQIKKRAIEEKLRLIHIDPNQVTLANLKRSLTVTSPTNGIVNAVYVNRGQYVSSSSPIFEIIQTGTPLLNIKAFENYIPYLKIGQELEAFTNSNAAEKITAKIVSISQHVNEDGSIDVLAKITNTNQIHFTTNMYFNVDLTYDAVAAEVLPEESIVHFEGKDYVFEAKENRVFELIEVKTGAKANGKIEISSALNPTKKYVSQGAYAILMAMKNSPEEE
nr:efflux RND transporter periplasmic adaptor subunit [uncultured Flavobacterium sp.]